ncbi:MAG: glycosyltransferase family 4 protein [Oscillospiraceae bacterium]|nr:glycosyltransferase family 4 protein [Oscillospiraceae bacterium]
MKKIGFVIPWFADNIPGGAEAALHGILSYITAYGVETEVLTTCVEQLASDWNINYYPEGVDTAAGVQVRRFPVRKRDTQAFNEINVKLFYRKPISDEEETYLRESINSPELYEYIEKNKDDYSLFVFIPYMYGITYYGCRICPEKSILIPCLHDEGHAYLSGFRDVYSKIKGMIFNTIPEYELAEKLFDLKNVDTEVIGIGTDTDISGSSERFKDKYSINDDFILYAGRKSEGKNLHTLVDYFTEYKKRNPGKLKLVLIGDGNINIPEQVKGDIIDLGFVPKQDKYDAFTAALVLCQPSLNESFSIVLMESWLCSRPVLVHAGCPVTKSFILESHGGLFFANYGEFEGCIDYLAINKISADTMGTQGRQFVINNYNWDAIIDKYIKFFGRIS